jgi:hypothetical protein
VSSVLGFLVVGGLVFAAGLAAWDSQWFGTRFRGRDQRDFRTRRVKRHRLESPVYVTTYEPPSEVQVKFRNAEKRFPLNRVEQAALRALALRTSAAISDGDEKALRSMISDATLTTAVRSHWLVQRDLPANANADVIAAWARQQTSWATSTSRRVDGTAPAAGDRCPCGATFLVRRRRSDGRRFLGCSAYPACRVTRPLPRK